MANLTVPQLIKIIIGIFVVVMVVIGIFLFFKDTVIDFFKNLPGDEEAEEIGGVSQFEEGVGEEKKLDIKEEPERFCEDCGNGVFNVCDEEECTQEINDELIRFNKKCEFISKAWFFGINKCITVNV